MNPMTHVIQLPNHMPTHGSNEVPGHMAGSCLEMGINGNEIISTVVRDVGWHGVRQKLEEWCFLVSQPQQ